MKKILQLITTCFLLGSIVCYGQEKENDAIMIFTKTAGYRHKSIEKGVEALKELGKENKFSVIQTEDASLFDLKNLMRYKTVVFLSTTMDVLNEKQEKAFENYIKGGGSFMGIHAASDTEYKWAWYGQLVGAYFESHPNNPNVLKAEMKVVDKNHPSTAHLESSWTRTDEWYNYKNINPDIKVLIELDEDSYKGGTNGKNHPIAWYHEFDGGRAFYTGGGHTNSSYKEPAFRQHLLGGILYCLGRE